LTGTNTPLHPLPFCDLTVTNGATGWVTSEYVTDQNNVTVQNLLIASNSFLVCGELIGFFTVNSDAVIQTGGGLIADGAGYAGGTGYVIGTVGGQTLSSNGVATGGGGANGGNGGNSAFGAAGGTVYDSIEELPGGGGGDSGGAGGGAIRLMVTGTLTLNGIISANGKPGITAGSGGGAGGGIYLLASNLSGAGLIAANGGSGQLPYGGGGGGGSIEILVTGTTNVFAGNVTAYGGNGANAGGAGQILEHFGSAVAQAIIDNGGLSGAITPGAGFEESEYDVSVLGGATVAVSTGLPGVRNLLIGSNSFLVLRGSELLTLIFRGNVTVQPTAGIVADGRGSSAGVGRGAGSNISGTSGGSGGGYGGIGGAAQGGAPGGPAYGMANEPDFAGSGGGVATGATAVGGQGGGGIQLTVDGTLLLQGKISANGANALANGDGGGSGGGVWLTVGALAGNGVITANGGSGQLPAGGGGGGGRIAVLATTNQFTGTMTAYGGAGFVPGGAGTVYSSSGNNAPGQIIIDSGGAPGAYTTVPATPSGLNVVIRGGSLGVLNATTISWSSLFVGSNSFLLQTSNAGLVTLSISSNVTVQSGGGIVLDGAGYGGTGLGSGGSAASTYGYLSGGGGGYGGYGGNGEGGAAGGVPYGLVQEPMYPGSGGGNGGGYGGGALTLTAGGTLEVDGVISANGAAAPGEAGGGGSGGSLSLSVTVLTGAGTISASGGAGDLPNGGGGGGGRIEVSYQSNLFTGAMSAFGGRGYVAGGAGTILLSQLLINPEDNLVGELNQIIIDNGGTGGAATPLGQPVSSFDLTVSGGAVVLPAASWSLGNLLVESNGVIYQVTNGGSIAVADNAWVQTSAAISANGQGWEGDTGPGPGTTATNDTGSGGGYGGMGGASEGGAPGGAANGSAQKPVGWGSGGGVLFGKVPNLSQGGGAIKLTVAGTLTINGIVSANGNDAIFPGAGGGAGGSVWLTAGTLAGAGFITANGGAGQDHVGGGGGGGRIAIYAPINEFAGVTTVSGGGGFAAGQNGTVYLSTSAAAPVGPRLLAPPVMAMSQIETTSLIILTWPNLGGGSFQVLSSTDLINWLPYGGPVSASGGTVGVTLSVSADPQRYFRLVLAN
jgi:hypothetical protein